MRFASRTEIETAAGLASTETGVARQNWAEAEEQRQLQVDGRGGFDPKEKENDRKENKGGDFWAATQIWIRQLRRGCCKAASRTEMENGVEKMDEGRVRTGKKKGEKKRKRKRRKEEKKNKEIF